MKNENSLLIFAHKAEAKSFLDQGEGAWKPLDIQYSYHNAQKKAYLLICGEGIFNALEMSTSFLSLYSDKISSIYNYGISGALSQNENLALEELYPISHCYLEQLDQAQFHSYPTSNKETKLISIISSSKRVLDKKYSNYLSAFAEVADRESWAIARVAKKFKKNFFCYKLISDFSGQKSEETNICDTAKENAHLYSEKFLSHFKNLDFSFSSEDKPISLSLGENIFYFTTTQERLFNNLTDKLKLKKFNWSSFLGSSDFVNLKESPLTSKKKTEKLLHMLNNEAHPIQRKINERINQVMLPLKKSGSQITVDQSLETSNFVIKKNINNIQDIENLKEGLNKLNYKEFLKIFEGDI